MSSAQRERDAQPLLYWALRWFGRSHSVNACLPFEGNSALSKFSGRRFFACCLALSLCVLGKGCKQTRRLFRAICRNPLVSFVYERGWRQGFAQAGFPGVDQEVR